MRVPPIQSHLRPVISDDRLSVNSNSRMAAAWLSFLGMVEHEAKPLQLVHGKFDPVSGAVFGHGATPSWDLQYRLEKPWFQGPAPGRIYPYRIVICDRRGAGPDVPLNKDPILSSIKRNHARTRTKEALDTYDQWWVHFPNRKDRATVRLPFLDLFRRGGTPYCAEGRPHRPPAR